MWIHHSMTQAHESDDPGNRGPESCRLWQYLLSCRLSDLRTLSSFGESESPRTRKGLGPYALAER